MKAKLGLLRNGIAGWGRQGSVLLSHLELGSDATSDQERQSHAEIRQVMLSIILSSLVLGLPVVMVLSALFAMLASFYASNQTTLIWLAIVWAVAAVITLVSRRLLSELNDKVRDPSATAARVEARLWQMAAACSISWSLLPVLARPSTATGWVLNATMLLAVMVPMSLLFGLQRGTQFAVIVPVLALGATTIAALGGNPAIGATFVLAVMTAPTLFIGAAARRIVLGATRHAAEHHELAEGLSTANERLAFSAQHDALTLLPNRTGYEASIADARALAAGQGSGFAVGFLDLDRFKQTNDLFGHAVGDELLVGVAERLRLWVRDGDVIARHGGDEFICVFNCVDEPTDATSLGRRLLRAFDEPIMAGGHVCRITASLGLVLVDGNGSTSAAELRVAADHALYKAKERGRNRVELFDADLKAGVARRHQIEANLRSGLERGEITGWFQPSVDVETGKIVGAEALARWVTNGVAQPPASFLDHAKEARMGWQVTRSVMTSVAMLRGTLGDSATSLAINVDPDHVGEAIERLCELRPEPGLAGITFEITETRLIDDVPELRRALAQVRGLGGRVVLDDFGTGYSSLSLLAELPIDGLKIDCQFTQSIVTSKVSRAIVLAIVDTAQRMDLDLVAEGVETMEQLTILRELGVKTVQGYFYSEAVPAITFEEMVTSSHRFAPHRRQSN